MPMRPLIMLALYGIGIIAAVLSAINILSPDRILTTPQLIVGTIGLGAAFFIWFYDNQSSPQQRTPFISGIYSFFLLGLGFLLMAFSVIYVFSAQSDDFVFDLRKIIVGGVGLLIIILMLTVTGQGPFGAIRPPR